MAQTIGSIDINAFSDLYSDSIQYFWFEGNASATYGAGVHVTLVPDTSFISNPTGQNILMNTDGISIRNGLLPMMTLDNDSLDFNVVDINNSTYDNVATFGASSRIGSEDSGNLLAMSNGIVVRDGLTELATFGANGSQIGQSNDSNVSITLDGMQVVTQDQVMAFKVSTSEDLGYARVIVCPSYTFASNATIDLNLSAGYENVDNGEEITYTFYQAIMRYEATSSMFYYTKAVATESYDFVFYKGTAKSISTTFTFVNENASDETDTTTMTVTIAYNPTTKKITVTTPNYYQFEPVSQSVGTVIYYNQLYAGAAYSTVATYRASTDMRGLVNAHDTFALGIDYYKNASISFVGDVKSVDAYSGDVTFTATTHGGRSDEMTFSLDENTVLILYTGLLWTPSEVTGIYLNVDSLGAVPVYSNGAIASGTNAPWKTMNYIGLYYDGSKFQTFYNPSLPYTQEEDGYLMYGIVANEWTVNFLKGY